MAWKDSVAVRWLTFFRSSIGRFIGLAFLGQFLVTGGVLLFVQQASHRAVIAAEQEAAAELREDLLAVHNIGGVEALRQDILTRVEPIHHERGVILLADRSGRVLAGNLGAWPATVRESTGWQMIDLYRIGHDQPESVGISTQLLPGGERLLTGVVVTGSLRLTAIYGEALGAAFLISVVLTLAIAIILGRVLARQVSGIAETANDVASGALHRRVETDGSGDAFDRLGLSINAMLERIDSLVSQLRMMTDGLAHDLKSPVTRLVSIVEQASAATRDETALDALESVRREAETLQTMLSTALLISRTEAGFGAEMLVSTDIGDLLRDMAEVYGPLVEESGFMLLVDVPEGMHRFPLHRELVSQALANLIENALKYAEGGSRITLSAMESTGGNEMTLSVADNGPGIPAERRGEAVRRFGRLDPARAKPGSGLGLSLVEAVARLHQGRIELSDNAPGLRVSLHLHRSA